MNKLKIVGYPVDAAEGEGIFIERLTEEGSLIGQHPSCDIQLEGADVNQVHARIFYQDKRYYFSDLGSTDGSVINNKKANTNQTFQLKSDDTIQIGNFMLIVKKEKEDGAWVMNSLSLLPRMMISHPYIAAIVVGFVFVEGALSLAHYDASVSSFSLPFDMDSELMIDTSSDFIDKSSQIFSELMSELMSHFN